MDLSHLESRLAQVEERLSRIESKAESVRATYLGENRVLVRSKIHDLLYIVDGSDRLIVPRLIADGIYEPDVTYFFTRNIRHHDNCIDVGANFGYYSVLLSRFASYGHHVAVEANPQVFELLKDNIFANWVEIRIKAINAAVADRDGTLTLHTLERRTGNTSITRLTDKDLEFLSDSSRSFDVRSYTLDSLPLKQARIDWVKVDVEGAEPLVMRGAERTIAENPDITIVMEWAPYQLAQAGFNPASFAHELEATDLTPLLIGQDGSVSMTSWSDVAARSYCNLALTKRPIESFR